MSLDPKPVGQTEREQRENVAQAAQAEIARLMPRPYSPDLAESNPRPVPLFVRDGVDPFNRNASGEIEPKDLDVPVLLRGVVAMLAAEGGAGKSMAALAMAVHVALSDFMHAPRKLWGSWRLRPWTDDDGRQAQPCAVLILGEDSMSETADRLECLLRALFNDDDDKIQRARGHLAGVSYDANGQIIERNRTRPRLHLAAHNGETRKLAEIAPMLAEYMDTVDPDLVVLDPAVRFMSGDAELDNAEGAAFIGQLETLWKRGDRTRHRATVLVTHHTNKASRGGRGSVGTEAARGASALTDNSRAVFTLAPNPNAAGFVTLRHTKHNGTARAPQLALTTHGRAVRAESELPDDVRDTLFTLSAQARGRAAAATTLDNARALVNVWRQVDAGEMPRSIAVMLTASDGRSTPKIGGELARKPTKACATYRDACAMLGATEDPAVLDGLRAWAGMAGADEPKANGKGSASGAPAPNPPPEDE